MRALRQRHALLQALRGAVGYAPEALLTAAATRSGHGAADAHSISALHGNIHAVRPLVSLAALRQPGSNLAQQATAPPGAHQVSAAFDRASALQQACHAASSGQSYWPAAAAASADSCRHAFASQAGGSGSRNGSGDGGESHEPRRGAADAGQRHPDQMQPPTPAEAGSAADREPSDASSSGWTQREVWNAPNAISIARLISGPVIASWIIAGDTNAALVGLVVSGILE